MSKEPCIFFTYFKLELKNNGGIIFQGYLPKVDQDSFNLEDWYGS